MDAQYNGTYNGTHAQHGQRLQDRGPPQCSCVLSDYGSVKYNDPATLTRAHPGKHDTLNQCCFNVDLPSVTLAQYQSNLGLMYHVHS